MAAVLPFAISILLRGEIHIRHTASKDRNPFTKTLIIIIRLIAFLAVCRKPVADYNETTSFVCYSLQPLFGGTQFAAVSDLTCDDYSSNHSFIECSRSCQCSAQCSTRTALKPVHPPSTTVSSVVWPSAAVAAPAAPWVASFPVVCSSRSNSWRRRHTTRRPVRRLPTPARRHCYPEAVARRVTETRPSAVYRPRRLEAYPVSV
jgi:hypothetical protein